MNKAIVQKLRASVIVLLCLFDAYFCWKKVVIVGDNSTRLTDTLTNYKGSLNVSVVVPLESRFARHTVEELCEQVVDAEAIIGCLGGRSGKHLRHLVKYYSIPLICIDEFSTDDTSQREESIQIGSSLSSATNSLLTFVRYSLRDYIFIVGSNLQFSSLIDAAEKKWSSHPWKPKIKAINSHNSNAKDILNTELDSILPQSNSLVVLLDNNIFTKNRTLWNSTSSTGSDTGLLWVFIQCSLSDGIQIPNLPGKLLCFEANSTSSHIIQDALDLIVNGLQESAQNPYNKSCLQAGRTDTLQRNLFTRRLRSQTFAGKTGQVSFNDLKERKHFPYKINELYSENNKTIQKNIGYIYDGFVNIEHINKVTRKRCRNEKTLCIVTVSDPPFLEAGVHQVNHPKECILEHFCYVPDPTAGDSDTYVKRCCSGYVVDILLALERDLNIEAEIYVRRKRAYGSYDEKTRLWGGMVEDLLEGKADMALAAMTVSRVRNTAIDFSPPIVRSQLRIMMHLNQADVTSDWFGFLSPFMTNLWFTLLVTSLAMVIIIWGIDRLSPYGHFRRNEGKNDVLNMRASFTYIWSSVFKLTLDSTCSTRSTSARFAYAIFSFATLVFIATYTANLIAHLVLVQEQFPITGIYDKKFQDSSLGFKFASTEGGSIESFFRGNSLPAFRRISQNLRTVPKVRMGVENLSTGALDAFIYETPLIQHQGAKFHHESFRLVGSPILQSSLAFGFRKGTPWNRPLSLVLMQYEEKRFFTNSMKKWFQSLNKDDNAKVKSMDIYHFIGLFLSIPFAVVFCILVLVLENVFNLYYKSGVRRINVASSVGMKS